VTASATNAPEHHPASRAAGTDPGAVATPYSAYCSVTMAYVTTAAAGPSTVNAASGQATAGARRAARSCPITGTGPRAQRSERVDRAERMERLDRPDLDRRRHRPASARKRGHEPLVTETLEVPQPLPGPPFPAPFRRDRIRCRPPSLPRASRRRAEGSGHALVWVRPGEKDGSVWACRRCRPRCGRGCPP
jgi:hypothetical protein